MREFAQQNLLSNIANEGRLQIEHIDSMARVIADFHLEAIPVSASDCYGSIETVKKWCNENFEQLRRIIPDSNLPDKFDKLELWQNEQLDTLSSLVQQRKEKGFVRECHGDLHLANVTLIDDQCTPFDCIEFNQELRCIDTMSEVAFVFMDLILRDYRNFAWRFLNLYLELSGDFAGLPLLYFYTVYRAMVRAKVEALGDNDSFQTCMRYLDLANSFTKKRPSVLICMHGLSGSGKSTVALNLAMSLGAIHIRSDVERKRLFNLNATADSTSAINQGIYTQDASSRTYQRLFDLADTLVIHGFIVIIDAAFLQLRYREQFRKLAERLGISHFLISCQAPNSVLRERIIQRQARGQDASEAGIDVLEKQIQTEQTLSRKELERLTTIVNHQASLTDDNLKLILGAARAGD